MTSSERKGLTMGWTDARAYATGTKAERRAIRRRLVKSSLGYGRPFWNQYRAYFAMACEDFARAIAEGRIARTCNPHKLLNLLDRADAAAA